MLGPSNFWSRQPTTLKLAELLPATDTALRGLISWLARKCSLASHTNDFPLPYRELD